MATSCQITTPTDVKIKKIAMLTDFSENAGVALHYAATMAREYGAMLVLAHAYLPPGYAYAAPEVAMVYQAFEDFRKSLENRLLDQTEAAYLRDIKCSVVLHEGTPIELLEDLEDIDLIVVGTFGGTGLEKAVLGSTAEMVFRTATVPVLTVGPHCHSSNAGKSTPGTVLYATDFSDGAALAVPYALSVAQKHDAELMLLHVVEDKDVEFSFERSMASAEPREKLHSLMPDDIELKHKPRYAVGFGEPDVVILEEANKHNAELIVLSARGAGSLACHFAEGTAYKVVAHAKCPVLTIRRN
jgi:nucleotide-binding universal stress UspA family protein